MTYYSEKEIIEACLLNDRLAQKALYDQYKAQMYTLAYRISGNFEDAADVLQEGFLLVFRKLHTFQGESKLGTWIHTIIARLAIKKIKENIHFDDLETVEQYAVIDWGTAIDAEYLEKAIAALPDGYRSIFTLYEIEGFKHREIADLLEISENTSKTQLFKAKKMLREMLNQPAQ